ncbi:MAG: hypothetical protein O3B21_12810 [Proteobacteria bacterium]|nr:hypothetical protein [Pseudomonadota bacterium]
MVPISLETLADLAKARYGLAAHCWRCNRWHDFDIAELVARIGNRSIVQFKPRCRVCGERATKQVTPPMPVFEGYPK